MSITTAITNLATLIANKIKLLNNRVSVLESWHSQDYLEWYRIYSDGWCEQGGFIAATAVDQPNVEVIFKKQFLYIPFVKGKNYINQSLTNSWGQARYLTGIGDVTQTSFYCSIGKTGNAGQGFVWEAKGYIDLNSLEESE